MDKLRFRLHLAGLAARIHPTGLHKIINRTEAYRVESTLTNWLYLKDLHFGRVRFERLTFNQLIQKMAFP